MPEIIAQGAEAIITLNKSIIQKDRIKKSYRHPILDQQLRKRRTKSEYRILEKASKVTNVPKLTSTNNIDVIEQEYIDGDKLSLTLNHYPKSTQLEVAQNIGQQVASLHDSNIIHGDLTTSNMLLKDNKIFLIDFGLGYGSHKTEDKAVDIHLLKQALEAKHFQNYEELYKSFLKGYRDSTNFKQVLERLEAVEKRGRYKRSKKK